MSGNAFIAVDWGTTNRRAYLIVDGGVIRSEQDDRGVTAIAPGGFESEVAAIRQRLGDLPMLLAGMVGSNIGWRVVNYVKTPADLTALAAGVDWIDERTAIVPGLSCVTENHTDVMRGEEVQMFGAAIADMVPADALLCQPGTHCKWATLRNSEITHFTTAMTGELFALLRLHSLIAPQLAAPVTAGAAFRAGVTEGARGDLAARLFEIRARAVLGVGDTESASYASGLLIGSDVAVRVKDAEHVYVLAEPALGLLYQNAIETLGANARIVSSEAAFIAGMARLWNLLK